MKNACKKFGNEKFSYFGTAKNHRDLNLMSWKLNKSGFTYRFLFDAKKSAWRCYKKKKDFRNFRVTTLAKR